MRTKKVLFYALATILGGCIPIMSIDPFYTSSDVVFEEKLLGTWADDTNDPNTTWIFSRSEDDPNNTYKLIFIDEKGEKGLFAAHLVRIAFFLIFTPLNRHRKRMIRIRLITRTHIVFFS